jgi:hypothetical protein
VVAPLPAQATTALLPVDLDGDSLPDVALTHEALGEVTVIRALPAAPFLGEPARHAVGVGPVFLAAGDLDASGVPDLVAANSGSGSISVLLNRGDGTFLPGRDQATGPGTRLVELADLNGDGALDAVTSDFQSVFEGALTVLLGDGRGGFGAPATLPLGDNAHSLALEDFDQDGARDIAIAYRNEDSNEGTISWYRGAGDGSFPRRVQSVIEGATTQVPRRLAAARLDPAGAPLLLLLTDQRKLFVLARERDGRFAARRIVDGQADNLLAAVDLDRDGRLDVATLAAEGREPPLVLHAGAGDGTLGPPRAVPAGLPRPLAAGLADLNGDGAADLAASLPAVGGGLLAFSLAAAPARFEPRELVALGAGPRALAVVPADGGRQDLLALDGHSLHHLRANAAGSLEAGTRRELAARTLGDLLAVDLDRDGAPEAVVTDIPTGSVLILPSRGLAGPDEREMDAGVLPVRLAAGDFDGDGLTDLAVADQAAPALTLLVRPLSPDAPGPRPIGAGSPQKSLCTADFDADGDLDLAAGARDGLQLLSGDGRGGFPSLRTLGPAKYAADLRAADLDGDGALDLLAALAAELRVFRAPGTAAAVREETLLGTEVVCVHARDLDGDGRLEVAAATREQLLILRGQPAGRFTAPERYLAGSFLTALVLVDLDGDGALEAAAADSRELAVTVLRPAGAAAAPRFRRGDVERNGSVGLADAIAILNWLFLRGPSPACLDAADADDNGQVNLTDAVSLLGFLFLGAGEPPPPGPYTCGSDPTSDPLACQEVCDAN